MRRCRTFIGICREAYSFRQDTKDGARSPRQRDRQWGQKAEDPWSGKTYQRRGGEREATSFEIKQQGDGRWRSECLAAKDNVRSPGKDSSNQRITCRSLAAYSQRLPSGANSCKKTQRFLRKITGKIICCNKRQQNGTFHPSSFTRSERLLFVCGIILISFLFVRLRRQKYLPHISRSMSVPGLCLSPRRGRFRRLHPPHAPRREGFRPECHGRCGGFLGPFRLRAYAGACRAQRVPENF